MKTKLLLFFIIVTGTSLKAQETFHIAPGTDVYFGANTTVSGEHITLYPSAPLILNGTALSKHNSLLRGSVNPGVSRAYRFSTPVVNFSGSILLTYFDDELNGIMESALRLNVHDGNSWQSFENSTNDPVANTVLTTSLVNISLAELSLANVALALPLQWKEVGAFRQGDLTRIFWNTENENNVSHFNVQRSLDSYTWTNVPGVITATNKTAQRYELTDYDHQKGAILYRIKQYDLDGKTFYSRTISLAALQTSNNITLFPNPSTTTFKLTGDLSDIVRLDLYSNTGSLIKSWKAVQTSYDIQDLTPGTYSLRLIKKTDKPQTIQITKL